MLSGLYRLYRISPRHLRYCCHCWNRHTLLRNEVLFKKISQETKKGVCCLPGGGTGGTGVSHVEEGAGDTTNDGIVEKSLEFARFLFSSSFSSNSSNISSNKCGGRAGGDFDFDGDGDGNGEPTNEGNDEDEDEEDDDVDVEDDDVDEVGEESWKKDDREFITLEECEAKFDIVS